MLGYSQVRHLDSAICARDRKRRTTVCLLGAGIDRVAARLDMCFDDDGTKPIVILTASRNVLCKVKSEELFKRF